MKWLTHCCLAILVACASSAQPDERAARAIGILRGLTDAAIRLEGFAALQKYAPDLVPMIDANKDQLLTLAEFEAVLNAVAADPEMSALLLATAIYLKSR